LSNNSVLTYTSILKNLYKNVFKEEDYEEDNFNNTEKIINYLKFLIPRKRKTVLSALVVITDKPEFRNLMLDDIKEYNTAILKQEKTDLQTENWLSKDEINKLLIELKKNADIVYRKSNPSIVDLQLIQNYIIICLLSGFYIPPRRSKDYIDFKIVDIDKDKDNYLDKSQLVFNSYKTSKTYGKQSVDIPKELKAILRKWIKRNPTEYLLFDCKKEKLSNVKLNQRLNKLFKKHSAINALRKSYLTDKFGDMIDKKNDIEKTFKQMGSSSIQFPIYVLKDKEI
jgi:integrase